MSLSPDASVTPEDPSNPHAAAARLAGSRVDCFEDFAPLRAVLGEFADARAPDPYQSAAWFENLARHGIAIDGRPLLMAVGRPNGGEPMCLPVWRQARAPAAWQGPAVVGLSNYYSSLFGPIGDPQACTVDACAALLRTMRRQAPVIDLQPLDADGLFLRHMRQALTDAGWWHDTYFCFGNWYLPVAGRSYAAYLEGLSSRQRNTIRRAQKKLAPADGWELEVAASPGPQLERAIGDWQAIYAKSWKVPEPFPRFVPELCRMAAAQGWLRLGVVRQGTVPVAAQIWFIHAGRALIFKLAYDEEYKRFSAGTVLSAELMRRAIDEDRVDEVDYLTGDDAYKADWMSHRRERVGLVAFDPRSPRAALAAARHFGARWWRRRRSRAAPAPAPAAEGS